MGSNGPFRGEEVMLHEALRFPWMQLIKPSGNCRHKRQNGVAMKGLLYRKDTWLYRNQYHVMWMTIKLRCFKNNVPFPHVDVSHDRR